MPQQRKFFFGWHSHSEAEPGGRRTICFLVFFAPLDCRLPFCCPITKVEAKKERLLSKRVQSLSRFLLEALNKECVAGAPHSATPQMGVGQLPGASFQGAQASALGSFQSAGTTVFEC